MSDNSVNDPYQDITFEMSAVPLVDAVLRVIAAAAVDDLPRARDIKDAWLRAIDLTYEDAREAGHMLLLIGFRNEIIATTPFVPVPKGAGGEDIGEV